MDLPKADPQDGVSNACDARPLTGANSAAEIFAMAVARCFNKAIGKWANQRQLGSTMGRSVIQNVFGMQCS